MYSVTVRDSLMVAHSLRGESFGPARRLHGATYVIDAEFSASALNRDNVVLDIALAARLLAETLAELNYRNLDELPELAGQNTTTEFLAHYLYTELRRRLRGEFKGELKMVLHESHKAWASFTGPLP